MRNECVECQGEAFRFCHFCKNYWCWEHLCVHLEEIDHAYTDAPEIREESGAFGGGSTSWLSYGNIIASLPDQKIKEAIQRYRSVLLELEAELAARRFGLRTGPSSRPSHNESRRNRTKNGGKSGRRLVPTEKAALAKFMRAFRAGIISKELIEQMVYKIKCEEKSKNKE